MTEIEQKLRRELAEAKSLIAHLEALRPPQRTPYERFRADGGTHREWVKRERRIAHMQNHY